MIFRILSIGILATLAASCARNLPQDGLGRSDEKRSAVESLERFRGELSDLSVVVKAPLSEVDARRVLLQNWPDLAMCLTESGITGEAAADTTVIRFDVTPGGEVASSPFTRIEGHGFYADCLADFIGRWKFPNTGTTSTVELSFRLRPTVGLRQAANRVLRTEIGTVCQRLSGSSVTHEQLVGVFASPNTKSLVSPLRVASDYFFPIPPHTEGEAARRVRGSALDWLQKLARRADADSFCLPLRASSGGGESSAPTAVVDSVVDRLFPTEALRECAQIVRPAPVTGEWSPDWESSWEDDRTLVDFDIADDGRPFLSRSTWSRFVDTECLGARLKQVTVPPDMAPRHVRFSKTIHFRTSLAERNARQAVWRREYDEICRLAASEFKTSPHDSKALGRVVAKLLKVNKSDSDTQKILKVLAEIPGSDGVETAAILRQVAKERGFDNYCPELQTWAAALGRPSK